MRMSEEGKKMYEDVRGRLFRFIEGHFPAARQTTLSEDTPLLEAGIVDSLGMLEIVLFIDRELRMELGDGDLTPENFGSISNIARFLENRAA
jgi:acyl carrier protein